MNEECKECYHYNFGDGCELTNCVYEEDKENKYTEVSSFKAITTEMEELYEIKNKNYGDSFARQFKEYGLTSVCIRLEDKLNRLKSLNKQGKEANADNESIRDTLIDMANYSVLAMIEIDKGE